MINRLRFFLAIVIVSAVSQRLLAQNNEVQKIPFLLNNGHIIIKLSLNDSEPLNFIFDSGAGATLVSRNVADSLGFARGAKRKNIGVSGEHKVNLLKGVKLRFKNKDLGNVNLLSTQTYFEELDNGQNVHGVIGYDLLTRYIIEVNYTLQTITLFQESGYVYPGESKPLPIYLVQNLPIINAKVTAYNGISFEGQFMVDTGARSNIIISSPSVIKYDLADNVGKYYTLRANIGTSTRRTKMRYGRLASLEFARHHFEDVPVALSSDNKGVLSMDFLDGLIGNKLLQRFNIVFNYSGNKVFFEPGKNIDEVYSINLTGFTLSFEDARPIIKNVIDRSPADKAGLRNGDEVISINSVLVENMSSDEIREAFDKQGEKLAIVIKRNNKYKYTEFVPEPMI